MAGRQGGPWYWCLHHERVEEGQGCASDRRMGPYPSPERAVAWHDQVEARNEAWEEEDRRWEGEER